MVPGPLRVLAAVAPVGVGSTGETRRFPVLPGSVARPCGVVLAGAVTPVEPVHRSTVARVKKGVDTAPLAIETATL